jgi:hypothetical protein
MSQLTREYGAFERINVCQLTSTMKFLPIHIDDHDFSLFTHYITFPLCLGFVMFPSTNSLLFCWRCDVYFMKFCGANFSRKQRKQRTNSQIFEQINRLAVWQSQHRVTNSLENNSFPWECSEGIEASTIDGLRVIFSYVWILRLVLADWLENSLCGESVQWSDGLFCCYEWNYRLCVNEIRLAVVVWTLGLKSNRFRLCRENSWV